MSTATVKVDNARIDRLKEQHLEHAAVDRQRAYPVHDGDLRGHRLIPEDHPQSQVFRPSPEGPSSSYIDDNLFVGSMASSVNAVYTYPEWNVEWMKEEKTVEKSKTPEDRKANEWALEYWESVR